MAYQTKPGLSPEAWRAARYMFVASLFIWWAIIAGVCALLT